VVNNINLSRGEPDPRKRSNEKDRSLI